MPRDKAPKIPVEEDFHKKKPPSPYTVREVPEAEWMKRRGYEEGLKHLQSQNFQDYMKLEVKPAFGMPTIHYTNKIPRDLTQDISEHSRVLWGMISKNLLVKGAMEGDTPRLT